MFMSQLERANPYQQVSIK